VKFCGARPIQPFEGSRFVRGGRYGISIDFGLEVVEKENTCEAGFKIEVHRCNHEAEAHDRLIVTPDRPFCKTPSRKSPMSLAPGTRKRPPRSGFVQTGFWETSWVGERRQLIENRNNKERTCGGPAGTGAGSERLGESGL
jgi:hypothetical protein